MTAPGGGVWATKRFHASSVSISGLKLTQTVPTVAANMGDTVDLYGTWNGSSWNASRWTGSTWNGSTWNGSSWNGSSWTGSSWTSAAYDDTSNFLNAFWGDHPKKGMVGEDRYILILDLANQMRERLRRAAKTVRPVDYIDARDFLQKLAYEARFVGC